MKVFTFEDKTFQQRIDEFNLVLDDGSGGGSIRDEWRDFLSVTIEPAFYKAIWRLSRGMCELFKVRYPAEVFGEVVNTDFESMAVDFKVEQVQDESIHLPEICQDVPLDEIFPTLYQVHSTLCADVTADHLDRYRFFFNYIFLPFDCDEDFAVKSLTPRVKLFYDLKHKQLSKAMSSYIRHIIAEVKHIQFKRDILNSSIDYYGGGVEEESKRDSKETTAKLLDLHLRMNKFKNEFEILINPEMRDAYEIIKFGRRNEESKKTFLLTAVSGTVNEQIKLLEVLKERVSSQTAVNWTTSLTDAIARATPESEIFISSGKYVLNFLDYLNGNVLLCGTSKASLDSANLEKWEEGNFTVVAAEKDSSLLFVIDGDVRFENLVIDCTKVKTGFLIKSGAVSLKNCLIIGSNQSSVAEAFNVVDESNLLLNECVISNFSSGIIIDGASKLELINCSIEKCNVGISAMSDATKVQLQNSSVSGGIVKYSDKLKAGSTELDIAADKRELEEYAISISDDSKTSVKINSKLLEEHEDGGENEDESMSADI